jgi:hypothetical protein
MILWHMFTLGIAAILRLIWQPLSIGFMWIMLVVSIIGLVGGFGHGLQSDDQRTIDQGARSAAWGFHGILIWGTLLVLYYTGFKFGEGWG